MDMVLCSFKGCSRVRREQTGVMQTQKGPSTSEFVILRASGAQVSNDWEVVSPL
jgi:hypothetical protein